MHPIGFMEGYRLMKAAGADWLSCVFMAFVWVLRGDKVSGQPLDKTSDKPHGKTMSLLRRS